MALRLGVGPGALGIMAVQAFTDGAERGHLIGDVPALPVVAIAFAALTPRGAAAGTARS